jgi:hypothetical protein
MATSKKFYTTSEAAEVIGLSANTLTKRCTQGKIAASRESGLWLIGADVVESERLRVASKSSKMGPDCYRKPHEPAVGYFTAEQAAKMVGVTSRTLARRAGDRLVPGARRVGRVWEFSQESVDHEIARLAGSEKPAAKTVPAAPKRTKAPAMTVKVKASEFTASLGVASDAEKAENRARLAQVAADAKRYVLISANGEVEVKSRL